MKKLTQYVLSIIICFNMLFGFNNIVVIAINILVSIALSRKKIMKKTEIKQIIYFLLLIVLVSLFSLFFYEEANKIYYIYQYLRIFSFYLLYLMLDRESLKKIGNNLILVMFFNSILVILYFLKIDFVINFLTFYQQNILGSAREVFGYRIGGLFSFLDGGMLSFYALIILQTNNFIIEKKYNIITIIILISMLFQARTPLLLFVLFILIKNYNFKVSLNKIKTVIFFVLLFIIVFNTIKVISYSTYVWLIQLADISGLESVNSLGSTITNSLDEIKGFSIIELLFGTGRLAWEGPYPIQTDNGYLRNFISIGLIGFILSTYIYVKNVLYIKNKRMKFSIFIIFIIFNIKGTLYTGYPLAPVFLFIVQYFKILELEKENKLNL